MLIFINQKGAKLHPRCFSMTTWAPTNQHYAEPTFVVNLSNSCACVFLFSEHNDGEGKYIGTGCSTGASQFAHLLQQGNISLHLLDSSTGCISRIKQLLVRVLFLFIPAAGMCSEACSNQSSKSIKKTSSSYSGSLGNIFSI